MRERAWTIVAFALLVPGSGQGASYIYAWGNGPGGSLSVVMAPVTGPGTLGAWSVQTAFPVPVFEMWAQALGGYLYCFGGRTGINNIPDVYSAPIGGGGNLGAWTSTTMLPVVNYQQAVVPDCGGFVYQVGPTPIAHSAPYGGGVVGAWTSQPAPAIGNSNEHAAIALNGFAFALGFNSVHSAAIGGGLIGTWTSQPQVPSSTVCRMTCAWDGRLYVVGGASANVFYAAPVGGTIPAWTSTTALPMALTEHSAVAAEAYVWVLGAGTSTAVYAAPILAGGALGMWATANPLPAPINEGFAVAWSDGPPTPCAPPTATATATRTPTSTPSVTASATFLPGTPTRTPSNSNTATQTESGSPTATETASGSPTRSATRTESGSPTGTRTESGSFTASFTVSPTRTGTTTRTATETRTGTACRTATSTASASQTESGTRTETRSPTASVTGSETSLATPTPPETATASPSSSPWPPTPTRTALGGAPYLRLDRNVVRSGEPLGIEFALEEDGEVSIAVFDSAGERIARVHGGTASGDVAHRIAWHGVTEDGRAVSSNVYVVRLVAGRRFLSAKAAVIR